MRAVYAFFGCVRASFCCGTVYQDLRAQRKLTITPCFGEFSTSHQLTLGSQGWVDWTPPKSPSTSPLGMSTSFGVLSSPSPRSMFVPLGLQMPHSSVADPTAPGERDIGRRPRSAHQGQVDSMAGSRWFWCGGLGFM